MHEFLSTLQVGTKNVVKCYKEFFGYFNALETNGAKLAVMFLLVWYQLYIYSNQYYLYLEHKLV